MSEVSGSDEGLPNEEWEVQDIVAVQWNRMKKRIEYQVRWRGYKPEDDTWEPEENVANSPDLVAKWRKKVKKIRKEQGLDDESDEEKEDKEEESDHSSTKRRKRKGKKQNDMKHGKKKKLSQKKKQQQEPEKSSSSSSGEEEEEEPKVKKRGRKRKTELTFESSRKKKKRGPVYIESDMSSSESESENEYNSSSYSESKDSIKDFIVPDSDPNDLISEDESPYEEPDQLVFKKSKKNSGSSKKKARRKRGKDDESEDESSSSDDSESDKRSVSSKKSKKAKDKVTASAKKKKKRKHKGTADEKITNEDYDKFTTPKCSTVKKKKSRLAKTPPVIPEKIVSDPDGTRSGNETEPNSPTPDLFHESTNSPDLPFEDAMDISPATIPINSPHHSSPDTSLEGLPDPVPEADEPNDKPPSPAKTPAHSDSDQKKQQQLKSRLNWKKLTRMAMNVIPGTSFARRQSENSTPLISNPEPPHEPDKTVQTPSDAAPAAGDPPAEPVPRAVPSSPDEDVAVQSPAISDTAQDDTGSESAPEPTTGPSSSFPFHPSVRVVSLPRRTKKRAIELDKIPEAILKGTVAASEVVFLVKFKDVDEPDLASLTELRYKYPDLCIKYLQERLVLVDRPS